MRPSSTRLLLLGAVAMFGPVNGYQVRRELLTWQVDQWAKIKPGSIYHGLGKLAEDGLLSSHQFTEDGRQIVVYEITDTGRSEFDRLCADAFTEVDLFDPTAFHAAFAMLPIIGLQRAQPLLTERQRRLRSLLAEFPTTVDSALDAYIPPHAQRGAQLWAMRAHAELAWLGELLDDIAADRLLLPGAGWLPPADDPAQQMADDRRRYRARLGSDGEHSSAKKNGNTG